MLHVSLSITPPSCSPDNSTLKSRQTYTLQINIATKKSFSRNRKAVQQPSLSRGYVSFLGCKIWRMHLKVILCPSQMNHVKAKFVRALSLGTSRTLPELNKGGETDVPHKPTCKELPQYNQGMKHYSFACRKQTKTSNQKSKSWSFQVPHS